MSWRIRALPRTAIPVAALICSVPGSPAPESRFAQVDGAKVHYTDYGAGENALLFVHGWSCDETFWAGQASALASKFHVITMILAKQPVWTPEYENFVRGLAPDLDYQTWEGVSHFLMMEKPNEFNAALTAFLEKHGLTKN